MDELERAEKIEQAQRDEALAKMRAQHDAEDAQIGTELCVDCEDLIPAARRKANPHAIRCIDCQTDWEAHH